MGQKQLPDGVLSIPMATMEVRLPVAEAADVALLASSVGVSTGDVVRFCTQLGVYGHKHPEVQAFLDRTQLGVGGTETDNKGGNNA